MNSIKNKWVQNLSNITGGFRGGQLTPLSFLLYCNLYIIPDFSALYIVVSHFLRCSREFKEKYLKILWNIFFCFKIFAIFFYKKEIIYFSIFPNTDFFTIFKYLQNFPNIFIHRIFQLFLVFEFLPDIFPNEWIFFSLVFKI